MTTPQNPPYSQRIWQEGGLEGASIAHYGSGASLQGASGALIDNSAGRTVLGTVDALNVGAAQTAACFASSRVKLATDLAASAVLGVNEVLDIGNGVKLFLARTQNAPSAAGSPGSIIIRLPGTGTPASAAGLYIKQGDNSPASAGWQVVQTGASAG